MEVQIFRSRAGKDHLDPVSVRVRLVAWRAEVDRVQEEEASSALDREAPGAPSLAALVQPPALMEARFLRQRGMRVRRLGWRGNYCTRRGRFRTLATRSIVVAWNHSVPDTSPMLGAYSGRVGQQHHFVSSTPDCASMFLLFRYFHISDECPSVTGTAPRSSTESCPIHSRIRNCVGGLGFTIM